MKTIKDEVIIKATPHDVYEAFMDSKKHSEFTGDDANISREIGGEFSAFGDYATGKNIELVPDKKIVQTWHASDWPEGHFSKISLELDKVKDGTKITFAQIDIPDEFAADVKQGWEDYYWGPMKEMLEK